MKHERMTFSLCLAAVLVGSLVSFSCLMCLAQTYAMPCNAGIVLAVCCLAAGLAAAAMGIKKSWLVTLNVFLLYLVVMLWQHEALKEGLLAALYYITNAFNLCFRNITILGNRSGDLELLFAALAIPLAWLTVWTVCKESYCIFVILACSPFLILSLIIVDLAANFWLVLLSAALLLLILSDAVRIRNANEGGVLLWWMVLPVALLVSLLALVSPPEGYIRSDWSQMLQNVAEGELNVDRWRKQGTTLQIVDKIDLKDLGPRKTNNTNAMKYYSQVPISYLRGASYGIYDNGTWENCDLDIYEGYGLPLDLQTYGEGQQILQIKTNKIHNALYTTYYLSKIPDAGQIIYDLYVDNAADVKEYSIAFRPDTGRVQWETQGYGNLLESVYLQVPEELEKSLYDILLDANLENASPQEIGDYVCGIGTYDLNTARVPDGKDFILYFLTEAHRGYCVHFASSTTLLLRAAGIPARYVTGYAAGGAVEQWNTVTENDAHAWVEYYVEGVGWIALDPTPAQWRDVAEMDRQPEKRPDEEEPEEKKPEQEDQPKPEEQKDSSEEGKQGNSSEKEMAASEQSENAERNGLLWLFALPVAVLFLLLRRVLWIIYRKMHCKKATPNQRALRLWVWLVKLYKADHMQVPEELICLAEKAKFSQHELTEEELAQLKHAITEQIARLKKRSFLHRLWHQYILALY